MSEPTTSDPTNPLALAPVSIAAPAPEDPLRRTLLQTAALLAVSHIGSNSLAAEEPFHGKPGDFDFLSGEWRIEHRRRQASGEWDRFQGEATCWSILSGVASIEELRIPARNFSGMGIRILDVSRRVWSDFWVNASFGLLTTPGSVGVFKNGVGAFGSEQPEPDGKLAQGVWDQITPTSCRWRQLISSDGGKSWEETWIMEWQRRAA
jgi:hypothetical protein